MTAYAARSPAAHSRLSLGHCWYDRDPPGCSGIRAARMAHPGRSVAPGLGGFGRFVTAEINLGARASRPPDEALDGSALRGRRRAPWSAFPSRDGTCPCQHADRYANADAAAAGGRSRSRRGSSAAAWPDSRRAGWWVRRRDSAPSGLKRDRGPGNRDGGPGIREGGSGTHRDWQLAPKGFQAVWSPRDLKVAYTVPSPSGQAEYYIINADGSGRRLLGNGPAFSEIHFAGPDDVAIAQSGSVAIVDAATGAIAEKFASYDPAGLVGLTGDAWAFSPDGSLLAANDARNARGLLVIGRDGSVRARIEPDLGVDAFAWRPDSGALAYVPAGAASVLLKVWDRASNQSRTLVNAGLRVLTLSWSPDGGVIAFSARPGGTNVTPGSFRLGFVNSDGTQAGFPDWAGPVPDPQWS